MTVSRVYGESGAKVPDTPDQDPPCACLEGWVFIGYIDEHDEEREASYRCRRCADDS